MNTHISHIYITFIHIYICIFIHNYLTLRVGSEKFISLNQSLRANDQSQVRVYGDASYEFTRRRGFGQICTLSSSIFNFVNEMVMETVLYLDENDGLDICSDKNLSDLEYVDHIV